MQVPRSLWPGFENNRVRFKLYSYPLWAWTSFFLKLLPDRPLRGVLQSDPQVCQAIADEVGEGELPLLPQVGAQVDQQADQLVLDPLGRIFGPLLEQPERVTELADEGDRLWEGLPGIALRGSAEPVRL